MFSKYRSCAFVASNNVTAVWIPVWHHRDIILFPLTGSCVSYLLTASCWTLPLTDRTWRTPMGAGVCPPHLTLLSPQQVIGHLCRWHPVTHVTCWCHCCDVFSLQSLRWTWMTSSTWSPVSAGAASSAWTTSYDASPQTPLRHPKLRFLPRSCRVRSW